MNTKIRVALFIIVSVLLLLFPVSIQLHLKKIPQIAMMVLGILTMLTFPIRHRPTTLGFFYVLFGLVLFLNIEQVVYVILKKCDVQYLGLTDCIGCSPYYDGLILGNFIGFVLAPLSVFILHRKKILSGPFNLIFTSVFTVTVLVIYLIKEVRS